MRLGFYMGYAQPGTSPLELIELAREAERLGYDSAWAAEAWGVDAVTPLAWLGAQTRADQARHGDHADPRPLAREHGDDGGDARPALRRPVPARASARRGRRWSRAGTAQEWGKPLGKTREYVEIVRAVAAPRAARASRRALRHPGQGGTGPRQAAEADGAAAASPRSRSTSRRSARRRSSRRSRSPTAGCRSSGRPSRRATCSRSTVRATGSTSRRRRRRC